MWYLPLDFVISQWSKRLNFLKRERERENLSITFNGNRYDT